MEQGFRTMKTDYLHVRPIYVRTESNTRGHVLVVMLAYLLVRELREAWAALDLTAAEGCLSSIGSARWRSPSRIGITALAYPNHRPK